MPNNRGTVKSNLPLRDFRIVTTAVNVPGPVAAARLRELGAKVVKIEPPNGDPLSEYCYEWYSELLRGQKLVRLNLKQTTGRERLDKLLSHADLLLTATRPAALRRLSLGWEDLHAKFSALCHVALVGHASQRQNLAGHDLNYQARVGLVVPPHMPNTLSADLASAERIVSAALGLLLLRRQFRTGFYTEVVIENVAADFAAPLRYGLTAPDGILGGGSAHYSMYPARQGWVAVAALEPHFLKRLQEELQLETVDAKQLSLAFTARTAQQWERWAQVRDLPITAVHGRDEVPRRRRPKR
ncbi:MAG: CoA transferase [Acidobacteriaceae bacterium]